MNFGTAFQNAVSGLTILLSSGDIAWDVLLPALLDTSIEVEIELRDLQENNIPSPHPAMYPSTLFYWDFIFTLIPHHT